MAPKKSSVWKYFIVCPAPNEHLAECTLCDEDSLQRRFSRGKASSNFSTKPLWNHLQSKHLRIFKDLQKEIQTKSSFIAASWSLTPQTCQPGWESRKLRHIRNPVVTAPQSHQQSWEPSQAKVLTDPLATEPQSHQQLWEPSETKYFQEPVATEPHSYQESWEPFETKYFPEPSATAPQSQQHTWEPSNLRSLNIPKATAVTTFICE